ncbi:MAG: membrane protein insertase YidC [Zetaproteobacteria bacterium]|nr:MAG: membrane protein insertase YidC [Zetaproteobacteria bacterium]
MEQKNMVLAFVLSMLVLLGWSILFPQAPTPNGAPGGQKEAIQQKSDDVEQGAKPVAQAAPAVPAHVAKAVSPTLSPTDISRRFSIKNDLLVLTIDGRGWLVGARLLKYRESIEDDAPLVSVLKISDDGHSVFMNTGVLGASLIKPFALVEKSEYRLHLRAELEGGRIWDRYLELKPGSYVAEVRDEIQHGAGLKIYRQVVEKRPDRKKDTFYEHMGPTGFVQGKLHEPDYDTLDEKGVIRGSTQGGWMAIMDRYFIASIIANENQDYPYYFKGDGRSYQAGLIDDGRIQGADASYHARIYIGPKSIPILKPLGVELERSVDFGWFAFIAKPMHSFLLWLYQYLHNFGWCIIVLVVLIKLLFFWPTQKSYESMAAMRKLQPELQRLKELYGDDRQQMSQEMMKLYKKHKVNPLGGCLPIVVQIPVFFALYKVLLISIEMRQAPFIGWIRDMSVGDPYFVLPILMGISMLIQQRLNPKPTDPMQAKVMQFLPILFTAMFLFFPAGLVLYWLVNNILSILQQWYVLKVKKVI